MWSENINNQESNNEMFDEFSVINKDNIVNASGNTVVSDTPLTEISKDVTTQTDNVQEEKKEKTQEEIKEENQNLEAPLNWTDPIVWHDPTFNIGTIVKKVEDSLTETNVQSAEQNDRKIDAIYIPLIKINQMVLDKSQIIRFSLISENFLPELELIIKDSNNLIKDTNSAGIDNEILVVITCPINGVYKKIKLPFYIDDVDTIREGVFSYFCKLKFNELYKEKNIEMNFGSTNEFGGCAKCKQSKNDKPNTWEMLHYIAMDCKLGFASTKQCKEIADRRYRFFREQYYKYLPYEQKMAGKDENSIFDFWIDVHGYLVMVNVPWILNADIKPNNLAIYAIKGLNSTNATQNLPDPQAVLVNRTLINSKNDTSYQDPHNLTIKSYEIITDNSVYNGGTLSTFSSFSPIGSGGENSINTYQIQVQENSLRGENTEAYETSNQYFNGIEMLPDLNILEQRTKVDRFFKIKRAKMLKVVMQTCNLGLERGTLVNVLLTTMDPKIKAKIVNNGDNLYQNTDETNPNSTIPNPVITDEDLNENNPTAKDIIQNNSIELPNLSISGIYYIDKLQYDYKEGQEQIIQTLWLIKKDEWAEFSGPKAYVGINTTATNK